MPPNTLYIASKIIQIQWGQDNEQVARQMYISHTKRNGCSDLCVHKCGFIIYSKVGLVGCMHHLMGESLIHRHSMRMVLFNLNVIMLTEIKHYKRYVHKNGHIIVC